MKASFALTHKKPSLRNMPIRWVTPTLPITRITAHGLTLDRPGFRQMEAAIQAGGIGAVLVTDFSRLGRDMWQVLRWGDSIKREGVAVLSVRQPGEPPISPITESLCKVYASQRHKKRR